MRCSEKAGRIYIHRNVGSVIPGSEIPRWFNNQFVSMGNSIRIDTSPVTHDNNWIGVVCCAIFHMDYERDMIGYRSMDDYDHIIPPVDLRRDLVIDRSDHMWLFYLSREVLHKEGCIPKWYTCFNDVIEVFTKPIMVGSQISQREKQYVKVYMKKYGYRWVYEQDRQLPISGT